MECDATITKRSVYNVANNGYYVCGCHWYAQFNLLFNHFKIISTLIEPIFFWVRMGFDFLVLSIIVIAMMSWFTNIITWFICVFVTVASIGITVVLWLTYYDVRNTVDTNVKYSYLEEFIRNENALYALAIFATIVMVKFCC